MNHDVNDDGLRFRDDFPCPYFDDTRTASVEYVFPDKKQTKAFHNFLAAGYRRYGCVFYRNVCTQCAACRPIRIETENFIPSRSQKRTLRRNSDVRIEHIAPLITTKKVELYRKYLISKHQEKEISTTTRIILKDGSAFSACSRRYSSPAPWGKNITTSDSASKKHRRWLTKSSFGRTRFLILTNGKTFSSNLKQRARPIPSATHGSFPADLL
jgi:hypothetical protein